MIKKKSLLRVLLTVFIFSVFFVPTNETDVFAQNFFVRTTGDAQFYSSTTSDYLFEIPKGYYLKVTGEEDDFYAVEYAKTENGYVKKYGYVLKSQVTAEELVLPLFLELEIYAVEDALIYSKPTESSVVVSSMSAGQKALYYGTFSSDLQNEFYYVYCYGDFGYVSSKHIGKIDIVPHPKPLPKDDEEIKEETLPQEDKIIFSKSFQIMALVTISIPLVIGMFFVFSKKNSASPKDYFS